MNSLLPSFTSRRLLSPLHLFAALLALETFSMNAQVIPQEPLPGKQKAQAAKESIVEVPGLPRVLLVGDSISGGYLEPVRTLLKGRANVIHSAENGGPTERGLLHLDDWLAIGHGRWDVIMFNFGLHDLKYLDAKGRYVSPDKGKQVAPLPVYEANLRTLVTRLKKTGAKLIFATTTPVPAGSPGRAEGAEVSYNAVAVKVMNENGVEVEDLHALVTPDIAQLQLPHNVHFKPAGYQLMAHDIAARIEKDLPPASGR